VIRQGWLILNVGVWTGLFGSVGLIGSLFEKNKGGFMGHVARWWGKTIMMVSRIHYSTRGLSHIQLDQEYIFAGNHESSLDIPLAFAVIPKTLVPVSKIELRKIPIMGWGMTMAGHIFVDRKNRKKSMESIREAQASLITFPRSVLIFPEGTRSVDGELKQFKGGGLMLAIGTGIPVIPMAFCGTADANKKGSYNIKRKPVELRFGPPIDPAQFSFDTRKEFAVKVRESVQSLIENGT
jgi:1-acyl-sn-glycerol-3-phosphate acyltransferase